MCGSTYATEKGKFLTFYTGELISNDKALKQESHYTESDGSFMFFFKHGRKMLWLVIHILKHIICSHPFVFEAEKL